MRKSNKKRSKPVKKDKNIVDINDDEFQIRIEEEEELQNFYPQKDIYQDILNDEGQEREEDFDTVIIEDKK